MSAVMADESIGDPWTEESYFALGERRDRIELVDGGVWMSPAPSFLHQTVSRRLANAIECSAPSGWLVIEAANVRIEPSRILIPDILVTNLPLDTVMASAADVALVVEVVSPSTVAQDRMFKPQLYATAGIPSYLRVELPKTGPGELVLHKLAGDVYTPEASVHAGEELRLTEPFPVEIDTDTLFPGRP